MMLLKRSLYLALVVLMSACANQATETETETVDTEAPVQMETQEEPKTGTVVQMVKLKSSLDEEELLKRAQERANEFRKIDGLVQKYYLRLSGEGEFAGIYIWDSKESLAEFKQSELAATIAEAYEVIEKPNVEIGDILFLLRE